MKGCIDIHSHVLPGLDDGSRNMEQSLHMLRIAQEQGIETVVATPHREGVSGQAERTGSPAVSADGCGGKGNLRQALSGMRVLF